MLCAQNSQPSKSQDLSQSSAASLASRASGSQASVSVAYDQNEFEGLLDTFSKKYTTADQDLYTYASSVFKNVQQDAKEWSVSMLYKEDNFGSCNKRRTGNIYKDFYKIFHTAAAEMQTSIDTKFVAAEGSDSREKKLCNLRKEAAHLAISRARKAAQKVLQRSYAREEERYKTERKIRAGLCWARLAKHLMPAREKEKEYVTGALGGPRRKPSAHWMNEQVRLHQSIVKGPHYRLAQQFLWGAKLEKSEVLLKLVQADKTDSKQTILVTPGYSKLAYFHYERETRLGNHTEARAWLIEAIYRAHLWDVKESAEWAEYFATAGRTGVHAAHTSSELQSLLGGVEGNLVKLLAGTEPFEYHEVKTTGTARLDSNAGSVWTTIHPRDAHSVFGRVCTDPDRKFTVVYTRRGGLCLWGHAHVTEDEPYTFYGEVGSPRQIAEPTNAEEHQRSQRGDYSHRHAIHGASYLLCGKFATPATPSGAGQWANHPADNVPATLRARRYAVRYTDSSGAKRVFYVLVLAAAAAQGQVELTHAYTDRFPGVWMYNLCLVELCVCLRVESLRARVCCACAGGYLEDAEDVARSPAMRIQSHLASPRPKPGYPRILDSG